MAGGVFGVKVVDGRMWVAVFSVTGVERFSDFQFFNFDFVVFCISIIFFVLDFAVSYRSRSPMGCGAYLLCTKLGHLTLSGS